MTLVVNPLIGSDVEFFLRDKLSGEIVSAENLIKGTKDDPYHFDEANAYFATQLDNVLAEGNIPPAKTKDEFYEYLNFLRTYINNTLPNNLETVAIPSARLNEVWLQSETSKTFGCDPSYNCWTGEVIAPEPTGDNLRSAGFHIHVGYENLSMQTNVMLAKAMDLFLGVPSVIMEPKNERKSVGYGIAGNFRHQHHGVEYRSLSSYFVGSKSLIDWCYQNTQLAIDFVNQGVELDSLAETIQTAINEENHTLATDLINHFGIPCL